MMVINGGGGKAPFFWWWVGDVEMVKVMDTKTVTVIGKEAMASAKGNDSSKSP